MAEAMTTEMKHLLDVAIEKGASDLHVTVGVPPMIGPSTARDFLRRAISVSGWEGGRNG